MAQTMQLLKQSNNPMGFLQGMAAMNPNMQPLLTDLQNSNGDPKAAFFAAAKRKGIDPNQVIAQMNQLGYNTPNS